MTTLAEIESAIDALPASEKEELLLFLAARLRAQSGQLPPPRAFTPQQIRSWITEDEVEGERFRGGAGT